jgi:anti-sigma B factor antagonist
MTVVRSTIPPDIDLIELSGSFLGGDETNPLKADVAALIDQARSKLIIDVTGVTYVNSTAVGILVWALIAYRHRGWQFKLCGESKAVYSILAITKLNLVFECYDTREEAIRSFR